ncbi:hypothetical protein CEXT_578261 [Caerostris extrusa]|uniref:Uncharacterized protein n=1 Tax=Caerostris extrusa TaxID=172846 RepID=A0AAV4UEK8_CAEEX|nr:hypothetical protein CEXT_578261 [Caerostris extrusa]
MGEQRINWGVTPILVFKEACTSTQGSADDGVGVVKRARTKVSVNRVFQSFFYSELGPGKYYTAEGEISGNDWTSQRSEIRYRVGNFRSVIGKADGVSGHKTCGSKE